MKLYCPNCSTPDPTVKKMCGFDRKSWKQHIAEFALWFIPVVGKLIQIGTTITDWKNYDMAICGSCNHKWDIKK